jgi:hypothetical protein
MEEIALIAATISSTESTSMALSSALICSLFRHNVIRRKEKVIRVIEEKKEQH